MGGILQFHRCLKKGQIKVKCLTVTCVVPVLLAALGAPPGGGGD